MATESSILFVNKSATSKSLSRSNGAERARIFSHVQRNPQNPQSRPDAKAVPEERPHGLETGVVWRLSPPHKEPTERSKSDLQRNTRRRRRGFDQTALSRGHSPLSSIGLAKYDPFDTTAAPITPYMKCLLDFYSSVMAESVFPDKFMVDSSRQHSLVYAFEDAVALNAILCAVTGMLYSHGRQAREGLYAMYFKGQAIHHLKQELSKPHDSMWKVSTLYAVSLLLWQECLQGDRGAVEAHTKGLDFLVTRVKGLSQSPLPIMTTILSQVFHTEAKVTMLTHDRCHYYCSAMLQTRPTIRPIILCEDLISESTIRLRNTALSTDLDRVCSQFFRPGNLSILGPALAQIILKQQRCLFFKELCGAEHLHPTPEDIQYIYTLQIAADFELLDLPYDEASDLTPVQDAVRLALYTIAQPTVRIATTSSAFLRSLAQQLKRAIDRCDLAELWAESADLLLWVLFVATYVSHGQGEWSSLIADMAMTVEALGIETESEMEEYLGGFVYLRKFCGEAVGRAWRDVEVILRPQTVDF